MQLSKEITDSMVMRLTEEVQPTRIFLFGSHARGAAHATSDVDICLVVPDDLEDTYSKTVRAYRSLRGFPFAKDILVRHEKRFNERSQWVGSIESQVQKEGVVIYSSVP